MLFTKKCYTEQEARAFVAGCEKDFDARVDNAVSVILEKRKRFICLCGPSCAGKTTTAKRIVDKLSQKNIKAHLISLDDFFFDMDYLVNLAQSKGGALDMDSADAMDLDAFSVCLKEIVERSQTRIPVFDFNTHARSGFVDFACAEKDVIIFEGIQAIYPEITSLVAPHGMISIFVCPDQPISVDEQVFEPNIFRFYRRIVRDSQYRSADAKRTLEVWRGVRNNEDAHIFPYREQCDVLVDSTMHYDIHLLTPYLRQLLPEVEEGNRYYLRALDILNRISGIEPIPTDYLSEDSLYHEFIKF